MDLKGLSAKELLQHHTLIIDELKSRHVVRTSNSPLGDYTEWLVAKALHLDLSVPSKSGYDAIASSGEKYQIKGRRINPKTKSCQLSAIRKYDVHDFDILAVVIFDLNYSIIHAILIPHAVIGEYATYKSHVNAHILHINDNILSDKRISNIKSIMIKTHI